MMFDLTFSPPEPDWNLMETQRLLSAAAGYLVRKLSCGSSDKLNYMLEESIMIDVLGKA